MKVLTANRLTDGAVVYLAADAAWTQRLDEALRLDGDAAAAALSDAEAQPQRFVGPYLIDADAAGPVGRERLREIIRRGGPTVGHSLKVAC